MGKRYLARTINENKMKQHNRHKFEALRKFHLPVDQYAITGSGPLGIRNLREIADIDIIVKPELRDTLAARFGIVDDGEVKKIVFPGDDDIEAFWEGSFYTKPKDDFPSVADRIAQAEIIDGLPFDTLATVLCFKRKLKREKDLKDIQLIEEWKRK